MTQSVKVFKKYFNRDLPLFAVQYWYEAEAHILAKMTESGIHFDPLFIHNKDRGVAVYYDVNTDTEPMMDYFANNPAVFVQISEKYREDCDSLKKILSVCKSKDIQIIFDKVSKEIAPVTTVIMSVGKVKDNNTLAKEISIALSLRRDTEKILYDAGDMLYNLIIEKYPECKDYADFLTIEEVLSGELPSLGELEERKHGFIYFEGMLYSGVDIKEIEKKNDIKVVQESTEHRSEIKGNVAQKGKVTGIVKIMFTAQDLEKVSGGDVIVASMTTPDFMPAMKKATAFVTDEGGITCHAAIVAREMGKPCIIGTKVATQVLKDGDFVEVDADNGIVKIIEKIE